MAKQTIVRSIYNPQRDLHGKTWAQDPIDTVFCVLDKNRPLLDTHPIVSIHGSRRSAELACDPKRHKVAELRNYRQWKKGDRPDTKADCVMPVTQTPRSRWLGR